MSQTGSTLLTANGSGPVIWVKQQPGVQSSPLGLICTVSSGASLTYTVEVTADAPFGVAPSNWNNHDVLVGQVASANSNILYPVTGVRLVVTNWVSGSVNLGVAQWP